MCRKEPAETPQGVESKPSLVFLKWKLLPLHAASSGCLLGGERWGEKTVFICESSVRVGGFILVLHTQLPGAGKVPPFPELPRPTEGTVALSETGML